MGKRKLYDVEKVVDRRVNSAGETEYLLKWVGYPENDNSWENEKNVYCKNLIKQFEARSENKEDENRSIETIQCENEPQTSNAAKRPKTIAVSEPNSKDTFLNDKTNRQRGYERNDKNLTVQKVEEDFGSGEISTILPYKDDPSFHLYEIVQRLIRSESGKIIPHFFRCLKCETIMNVNTSTHRPALERHFQKCTNKKKEVYINEEKKDNQISGDRTEIQRLIEACIQISSKFPVDMTVIPLPSIFNKTNCDDFIKQLRDLATQHEKENIGSIQTDEK